MNTQVTRTEVAVINVAPMIDVLLVLLIVFMAIAPQRSVGLDALVPGLPQDSALAPEDPVVLEIAANGDYRLNSDDVGHAGLVDRLRDIFARRAHRLLFVKADEQLEFRTVAEAIDNARRAAVDRVALMPR